MSPANPKTRIDPVVVARCDSYSRSKVEDALTELMGPLGDFQALVAGKSLMIKPNFLVPRRPEAAVNTHPELIRAVAQAALEKGASRVAVDDFRMPRRFAGRRLGPVPRFAPKACSLCRQCLEACQAGALRVERGRIRVDKRTCIRCYCCQEICPEGANRLRGGWFRR